MKRGKLITIEGIEGAGKSTAIQCLTDYFQSRQKPLVLSREPGGTEIAEDIRKILLRHHQETMLAETELLLMFASRSQHIEHVIRPALAANKVVISDRLTDSSYAYQGGGRGVDNHYIEALEKMVHGDLTIDLTLLLDVDPDLGMKRAAQTSEPDRIESEQLQFFTRVREAYLQRADVCQHRFHIINADQSIEQVKSDIIKVLDNHDA